MPELNRAETSRQIGVMESALMGAPIECRPRRELKSESSWDLCKAPSWNWQAYEYRVVQVTQNPQASELLDFIQTLNTNISTFLNSREV